MDLEELDGKMKEMEGLPQEEFEILPQNGNEDVVPPLGNIVSEETLPENKSGVHTAENLEVNVVDCTDSPEVHRLETENDNATESMSSFSGAVSETDSVLMLSDSEVQSCMPGSDMEHSLIDGCSAALQTRRRRLTEHWRRFIHPLMWRCKWIELRLKEFQSQALKYDREIAEIEQRKKFDNESFMVDGFEGKSKPFSCSIPRDKVMKRKRRKRFEEMTDIASYTLQHNLLSYYEIKKAANDGAAMDGELPLLDRTIMGDDNHVFRDGWTSLHSEDLDIIDEKILTKVVVLQSRVSKLRSQIDVVVRGNPGKFSYVTSSSPEPCDVLASTGNPGSITENGGRVLNSLQPLSHPGSEDHLEGLMPESAVSSREEVAPLPDSTDSKDGLSAGLPHEITEVVATHNQPPQEEMAVVKNLGSKPEEKPQLSTEKLKGKAPTNPQSQTKPQLVQMQCPGKSLPKSRSRPTSNKRKRGKRRSGASGWSRRA
ncbi:hypothetical protein LINPERHAP2_LOCUS25541 [Linum perenne]